MGGGQYRLRRGSYGGSTPRAQRPTTPLYPHANQFEKWRARAGGGLREGYSDGHDHLADDISAMRYVRLNMRDIANNAAHYMAGSQAQAACVTARGASSHSSLQPPPGALLPPP